MKDRLVILKQLDRQLLTLKAQGVTLAPKEGWARTIRKALGITIKQLAKRLDVDPSRVVKIETSEVEGALTLRSLQLVAEALGCTLAYSFIPKSSLEEMVQAKAKQIVLQQIKRTSHTMNLEAQGVSKAWLAEQQRDLIDELLCKPWKYLWEK
jgi:predicted DNA-binding mobile mystery protein A